MASTDGPLSRLYNNELWSDMIIRAGNEEIYAHKIILAQQSKFFAHLVFDSTLFVNNDVLKIREEDMPFPWFIIEHMYRCREDDFDVYLDPREDDDLDGLIEKYRLAGLYHCDSLRRALDVAFHHSAMHDLEDLTDDPEFESKFIPCIAEVCGPKVDPERFGDLLPNTIVFLFAQFCQTLFKDEELLRAYEKGTLFSAKWAAALGLELSKRFLGDVAVMSKKQSDPVMKIALAKKRNTINLFGDARLSDFQLIYGNARKVAVHKVVLAGQSARFAAELKKDPTRKCLALNNEWAPDLVEAFLSDLYIHDSPLHRNIHPSSYADLFLIARFFECKQLCHSYQARYLDYLDTQFLSYNYLPSVIKTCGPNSQFTGTLLAELVYRHVVGHVKNAGDDIREQVLDAFANELMEGTLFDAAFAGKFAKDMMAAMLETSSRGQERIMEVD